jgi:hypothetical protein
MSMEEIEKVYKKTIRTLREKTLNAEPKRFAIPFSSVLENTHSINLTCEAEEYSQDKYYEFKNILKSEFLSH